MSVSLGELVIDLCLNTDGVQEGFDSIYDQGLMSAQKLEGLFSGIKPSIPSELHLKPTVDASALHDLNRVFDLKSKHAKSLQAQFDAEPLTPKVDLTQLKALEKSLKRKFTADIDLKFSLPNQPNRTKQTDVANDNLAKDIGQAVKQSIPTIDQTQLGDTIAKSVSGSMPKQGILGQVTGAVGGLVGTAGRSLLQGALEPVTANLGKGLQQGLDAALSSAIGSTELLGQKLVQGISASGDTVGQIFNELFEAAIEDLPEGAQEVFQNLKKEIVQGLKEDLESINQVVSGTVQALIDDETLLQESLMVQGRSRQQELERRDPARREVAQQRQERFRDVEDRKFELDSARQSVSDQQAILDRGSAIEAALSQQIETLGFDIKFAETEEEASQLSAQLAELQNDFNTISEYLAQASENLVELEKSAAEAEKAFNLAKEAVKATDAQFKQLKPEDIPRILREALSLVGGDRQIDESMLPRFSVDDQTLARRGSKATYDIDTNTVLISSEMAAALEAGTATADQIQTILHEIQHAFDFDFGSFEGINAIRRNELLRSTSEAASADETANLQPFLAKYDPSLHEVEGHAELQARRLAPELMAKVAARNPDPPPPQKVPNIMGLLEHESSGVIQQLVRVKQLAESTGADVSAILEARQFLQQIFADTEVDQQLLASANPEQMQGYLKAFKHRLSQVKELGNELDYIEKMLNDGPLEMPLASSLEPAFVDAPQLESKALSMESHRELPDDVDNRVAAREEDSLTLDDSFQGVLSAEDGLSRAKAIGKQFELNYQVFKESLNSGDAQLIDIHTETIARLAEAAKGEVAEIIETLKSQGVDVRFASELGGKLNNIKGQLTRKQNLVKKLSAKARDELAAANDEIDELRTESLDRIDLDGLKEKTRAVLAEYGFSPQDSFAQNVLNVVSSPKTRGLVSDGAAAIGGPMIAHAVGDHTGMIAPMVARIAAETAISVVKNTAATYQQPESADKQEYENLAAILRRTFEEMFSPEMAHRLTNQLIGTTGGLINNAIDSNLGHSVATTILEAVLTGNATRVAGAAVTGTAAIATDSTKTLNERLKDLADRIKGLDHVGETTADVGSTIAGIVDSIVSGAVPAEAFAVGKVGAEVAAAIHAEVKSRLASSGNDDDLADIRSQSLDRRFNEEGDRFNTRANREGATPEEIKRLKELDELLRRVEKNADIADAALERMDESSAKKLDDSFQSLNSSIEDVTRLLEDPLQVLKEIEDTVPGLSLIPKPLKNIAGALGALGALAVVKAVVDDFVVSSFEAAINFEKLENTFKFVTGSASEAAGQIRRIREEANSLGTDANEALSGYSQLASATRGTSLEGTGTEQLSSAIQQAAAVSQLDAESLQRANTAISQIAGKGKLSAEELRQQLAEVGGVFSGSFSIAARSIGVTTAELDKMLQRGEVLSEDFLPKFAMQLAAETAGGVAGSARTAQAAINRFNNQVTELQESFGKPLVDARKTGLNIAVDVLEKLIDLAPLATSLLAGLIAKLTIDAGVGLFTAFDGAGKVAELFGGPSFGEVDIETGRKTSFGDRTVDAGLDLLTQDVGVLAGDVRDKVTEGFNAAKANASKAMTQMAVGMQMPKISIESIKVSAVTMGQTVSGQFTAIAVSSAKAALTMSRSMIAGVLNIGKAALSAGASIAKAMAPMLGLTLAFEGIQLVTTYFSDLSGEIGEAAEAAADLANNYKLAIANYNEFKGLSSGTEIGAASTADAVANQNVLQERGGFGGFLAGAENFMNENRYAKAANQGASVLANLSTAGLAGRLREGVVNQVAGDDIQGILDDAASRGASEEELKQLRNEIESDVSSRMLSGVFDVRAARQKGDRREELLSSIDELIAAASSDTTSGQLNNLKDIDAEVERLQKEQRNATDPRDKDALRQQINGLLAQRETEFKPVGSLQASLASAEEFLNARIEQIGGELTAGTLSKADYDSQLQDYQSRLAEVIAQQDELANSIQAGVDASALMVREFERINAVSQDNQMANEIANAQRALELATNSQGMGAGAIERMGLENDIQGIESEIALKNEQMAAIAAELANPEVTEAFRLLAGQGITADMGATELLNELSSFGEDNTQVNILRTFAEQSIELQSLKAETLNLDANLAGAQNDLQQQARDLSIQYRDLTEEISDFYRDAYRSAEDVANEIASQDLQNITQEISNDIQRELLGLEDSFVSGIGDTFTGLIESLRQPLLDELDAINQRNGIQREFEDSMRAARDMQRQADEFDFENGFGADPNAGLPQAQALGVPFMGGFMGEPSYENPTGPIAMAPTMPTNPTVMPGQGLRNDDIAAAADLATRSRDEQLAAVDRNMATQADTASLAADRAIADIARQLEDGRRTIAEQSEGFARSLRDIGEGIGDSNPLRELESALLDVSDQFEDTNRDLEDFKRGLQDTITETSAVREQLLAQVAAGTIGQEALAILPDLDRTIAESQAALTTADRQIVENRELLEAQRQQIIEDFQEAERDRRKEARRRIIEGAGETLTAQIDNANVSPFRVDQQRRQQRDRILSNATQEAISIGFEFDAGMSELDDLLKTGEITNSEYEALKYNLESLNEIRLDGLQNQFKELLPTVDAIASALSQARGDLNPEAFRQISDNLRLAEDSGALTGQQARAAREGLREAERLSQRSDTRAIEGLMSSDNAFTAQFLSQAGRGDLVSLSELGIQNREAAMVRDGLAGLPTDPTALSADLTRPDLAQLEMGAGAFIEGSDRMVSAIDRLIGALESTNGGGVQIGQQIVQVSRDDEQMQRAVSKKFNELLNQPI